MATPAFDATRFVRPALRAVILYISLIMIALMTMVKPAEAAGTVTRTIKYCIQYAGHLCNTVTSPSFFAFTDANTACQSYWPGNPVFHDYGGGYCTPAGSVIYTTGYLNLANASSCSGYTCTCNDGYEPDPTHTSCVISICPAHASRTTPSAPCACDAGYEFDATRTSCVLEQYTISIQPAPTNNGAYTILPSTALPLEAVVTDQNGVVQAGKQVTLTVDVQGGSGGHDHNENRPKGIFTCGSMGTSWTCTLTTGYNGQAPFIFVSTPVSGAHTITATCRGCGNTATAPVNVKVDNLIPIPDSPLYALNDSAGKVIGAIPDKHTANHYLTATAIGRLKKLAKLYTTTINPNKILYLNDASLVWGGLFDVGSTPWSSPHSLHDTGVSLDIRAANSGPNNEGVVPDTLLREFIKQSKQNNFNAAVHCNGSTVTSVCLNIPYYRHIHVDF